MTPRIGSLFTGYGGLDLAVEAYFAARTVWTSDIDPGASKIIAHRMPHAPNLGDLTLVDWSAVEPIEILTGGFPCQDVSTAGKRAGLNPGTRSGLWSHMAYAIDQLRPQIVVAENVRGLLSAAANSDVEPCPWCVGGAGHDEPDLRALGAVLGDLAELGYDATWIGLRAADVGAPHGRFRVFVVATDTRGVPGDKGRFSAPGQAASGRPCGIPAGRRGAPAADPDVDGLTQLGRFDTVERHPYGRGRADVAWGAYEPAIRRWEAVSGRAAPAPTETGPKGGQRLSPRFVEWMMGLPAGWVTDVPDLGRNAQLKALGNGVVWQQAYEACRRALS